MSKDVYKVALGEIATAAKLALSATGANHVDLILGEGGLEIHAATSESLAKVVPQGPGYSGPAASATLSAEKLAGLLRGDNQDILVHLSPVGGGGMTIKGAGGRFRIPEVKDSLTNDMFNAAELGEEKKIVTLPGKELADAIRACNANAAHKDIRYYLNALYIHRSDDGHLCFAGTDGVSMNIVRTQYIINDGAFKPLLMPIKMAEQIEKVVGNHEEVTLSGLIHKKKSTMSMMVIESEGIKWRTRLIEGIYPDIYRVLPDFGDKDLYREVSVPVARLRAAIQRVAAMAESKELRLVFSSGGVCVKSANEEQEEIVDGKGSFTDGGRIIGFFSSVLLSALSHVPHEMAKMYVRDASSPVVIIPESLPEKSCISSWTTIVMPARV